MLYQIFYPLRESFFGFNIFRYITFRTAGAVATALILVFMFAPNIIEKLKKLNFGQIVRDDGPESHLAKTGTPIKIIPPFAGRRLRLFKTST